MLDFATRSPLRLLWIVALWTILAACTAPGTGSAGGGSPLGLDPARVVIVDFQRTGGLADVDDHARLYLDGRVILERKDQESLAFRLSAPEQAQVDAAFSQVDFHSAVQQVAEGAALRAQTEDGFAYSVTRNDIVVRSTLQTADGAVPEWARSLLNLLDSLLLTPKPDAVALPQVTALPPPDSVALVLVEFRRTGGPDGVDDRLLVHVDRTFSVATDGRVIDGELSRDEMAALLRMMEAAQLPERRGDYLPEQPCPDCLTYELVYRNLITGARVRSAEPDVPDWFRPLIDSLTTAFLEPAQLAVAATPATPPAPSPTTNGTASPTATLAPPAPTATAAAPAPTSTPAPILASPTAVPTAALPQPAPTLSAAPAFSLADMLGQLAVAGFTVQPVQGQIVKPFISTPGRIVRIDGRPVQVFEYADATALAADVATLAPDGSSMNGIALSWPAGAPAFWAEGRLLVLVVGPDPVLAEALNGLMGPPVAAG